jgi:hypothetical protein
MPYSPIARSQYDKALYLIHLLPSDLFDLSGQVFCHMCVVRSLLASCKAALCCVKPCCDAMKTALWRGKPCCIVEEPCGKVLLR